MRLSPIIKIITSVLCVIFTTTTICVSAPDYVYRIRVPEEYGKVKERWRAVQNQDSSGVPYRSEQPTIILIEDAHTSLEAQENIAKIINTIALQTINNKNTDVHIEKKTTPTPLVSLEGAIGDIDIHTMRNFPVAHVRDTVAHSFLSEGIFSGAEYAGITSPYGLSLYGAEDATRFMDNYNTYLRINSLSAQCCDEIAAYEKEIDVRAQKIFSADLKTFYKNYQSYREGKISLQMFIAKLLEKVEETTEGEMLLYHFPDLCRFRELLKQGQETIPGSTITYLLQDIEDYSSEVCTILARTREEKEILTNIKGIYLLKKICTLTATTHEYATWKRYQKEKASFFLATFSTRIRALVSAANDFYENASLRSADLVKNTLKKMNNERRDVSILVGGGFHTQSITEALQKEGVNYVVITPQITQAEVALPYNEKMTGGLFMVRPELSSYITILSTCLGVPEDVVDSFLVNAVSQALYEALRTIHQEEATVIMKKLTTSAILQERIGSIIKDVYWEGKKSNGALNQKKLLKKLSQKRIQEKFVVTLSAYFKNLSTAFIPQAEEDATWQAYVKNEGLDAYPELQKLFTNMTKEICLNNPALRPVFLRMLPTSKETLSVYDKKRIATCGKIESIDGTDLLLSHCGFSIGIAEKAHAALLRGESIFVAFTTRKNARPFAGDNTYSNGRQCYLPLKNGTWLALKGSGKFFNNDDSHYERRDEPEGYWYGLVVAAEMTRLKGVVKNIREYDIPFVRTLAAHAVRELPAEKGIVQPLEVLEKTPRGKGLVNAAPHIVFNHVLTPYRLIDLLHLFKDDAEIHTFVDRLKEDFLYKERLKNVPEELVTIIAENMGKTEAVKQNLQLFKKTFSSQDITIFGEEADIEELVSYDQYCGYLNELNDKDKPDEKSISLLRMHKLWIDDLAQKIEILMQIIYEYSLFQHDSLHSLERLFSEYFKQLDDKYLQFFKEGDVCKELHPILLALMTIDEEDAQFIYEKSGKVYDGNAKDMLIQRVYMLAQAEWETRKKREVKKLTQALEKKYQAVLMDVDGTITDERGDIDGQIIGRIVELLHEGVYVGVISGRDIKATEHNRQSGSWVMDMSEIVKRIHAKIQHEDVLEKLIFIGQNGSVGVNGLPDTHVKSKTFNLGVLPLDEEHQEIIAREIQKKWGTYINQIDFRSHEQAIILKKEYWGHEIRRQIADDVQAIVDTHDLPVDVIISNLAIDIFPKGVSKRNAVEMFMNEFSIPEEAIATIGDSGAPEGNDYGMLEREGGFCVGSYSSAKSKQVSLPLAKSLSGKEATLWLLHNLTFAAHDPHAGDINTPKSTMWPVDQLYRILKELKEHYDIPFFFIPSEVIELLLLYFMDKGYVTVQKKDEVEIFALDEKIKNTKIGRKLNELVIDAPKAKIKAMSFKGEDNIWRMVGFEKELAEPDVLKHELQEIRFRKDNPTWTWVQAHNKTVELIGKGDILDEVDGEGEIELELIDDTDKWTTKDDALRHMQDRLREEWPDVFELYDRIETLNSDEEDQLCRLIYERMNYAYFHSLGFGSVFNHDYFNSMSYIEVVQAVFELLEVSPVGFRNVHKTPEDSLASARYRLYQHRPDIMDQYNKLKELSDAERKVQESILQKKIYGIKNSSLETMGIQKLLIERNGENVFVQSRKDMLMAIFPDIHLDPFGFGPDWSTFETSLASMQYILWAKRPDIMSSYEKIDKLDEGRKNMLREKIFSITSANIKQWKFVGAQRKHFHNDYRELICALFPHPDLAITPEKIDVYRKTHKTLKFTWKGKTLEECIENIYAAMHDNGYGITGDGDTLVERYRQFKTLDEKEKEGMREVLYSVTQADFSAWGLSRVYSPTLSQYFHNSHIIALIKSFQKLELNPLGFELNWKGEKNKIVSMKYILEKVEPEIMRAYYDYEQGKVKLDEKKIAALKEKIYHIFTYSYFCDLNLKRALYEDNQRVSFGGRYEQALAAVFPKLNLNHLGFGLKWKTRRDAIDSILYQLRKYRPDIMNVYDRINSATNDEIQSLKGMITAITLMDFRRYHLRGALDASPVLFNNSYIDALCAVFDHPRLNLVREDFPGHMYRGKKSSSGISGSPQSSVDDSGAGVSSKNIKKRFIKDIPDDELKILVDEARAEGKLIEVVSVDDIRGQYKNELELLCKWIQKNKNIVFQVLTNDDPAFSGCFIAEQGYLDKKGRKCIVFHINILKQALSFRDTKTGKDGAYIINELVIPHVLDDIEAGTHIDSIQTQAKSEHMANIQDIMNEQSAERQLMLWKNYLLNDTKIQSNILRVHKGVKKFHKDKEYLITNFENGDEEELEKDRFCVTIHILSGTIDVHKTSKDGPDFNLWGRGDLGNVHTLVHDGMVMPADLFAQEIIFKPYRGEERRITVRTLFEELGIYKTFKDGFSFESGGTIWMNSQTGEVIADFPFSGYDAVEIRLDENNRVQKTVLTSSSLFTPYNAPIKPMVHYHFHPFENIAPSAEDLQTMYDNHVMDLIISPSGKGRLYTIGNRERMKKLLEDSQLSMLLGYNGENMIQKMKEKGIIDYIDVNLFETIGEPGDYELFKRFWLECIAEQRAYETWQVNEQFVSEGTFRDFVEAQKKAYQPAKQVELIMKESDFTLYQSEQGRVEAELRKIIDIYARFAEFNLIADDAYDSVLSSLSDNDKERTVILVPRRPTEKELAKYPKLLYFVLNPRENFSHFAFFVSFIRGLYMLINSGTDTWGDLLNGPLSELLILKRTAGSRLIMPSDAKLNTAIRNAYQKSALQRQVLIAA